MSNRPERRIEIATVGVENSLFVHATQLADQLLAERNNLLAIWGMTTLQHNALWALYVYDPKSKGLSSGEIGKHLYTRVPDVTRLLDRLAERGWLTRERDPKNRRVVRSKLTAIGIELVESVHTSLQRLEHEQLQHLDAADKQELEKLLGLAVNNTDDNQ